MEESQHHWGWKIALRSPIPTPAHPTIPTAIPSVPKSLLFWNISRDVTSPFPGQPVPIKMEWQQSEETNKPSQKTVQRSMRKKRPCPTAKPKPGAHVVALRTCEVDLQEMFNEKVQSRWHRGATGSRWASWSHSLGLETQVQKLALD